MLAYRTKRIWSSTRRRVNCWGLSRTPRWHLRSQGMAAELTCPTRSWETLDLARPVSFSLWKIKSQGLTTSSIQKAHTSNASSQFQTTSKACLITFLSIRLTLNGMQHAAWISFRWTSLFGRELEESKDHHQLLTSTITRKSPKTDYLVEQTW